MSLTRYPASPIRSALLAGLAAMSLAASALSSPAAAQWVGRAWGSPYAEVYPYRDEPYGYPGYRARPLPPVAIMNNLSALGFRPLGRPRFDGAVYQVDAIGPGGRRVRLSVDAFRGDVVDRQVLAALPGSSPYDEADDPFVDAGPRAPIGRMPYGRAAPSPFDEMPAPSSGAPRANIPPATPRRDAAVPSPAPELNGEQRLPAPTDPRLGPQGLNPTASRRASAPKPASKRDTARSSEPALRPDKRHPTRPDSGQEPPIAAASPAAPAPADARAQPGPQAAAADAPRKPVRVIDGVTPMNGGSASGPPGPAPNASPAQP